MNKLLDVPIATVTALSAERAVDMIRAVLRSECSYAKLNSAALTISSQLTTPDGGIDAQVNVPPGFDIPVDCLFQSGVTGFQIKSGATFKPWTRSAIRSELLDQEGRLYSEVERLMCCGGRYTLICMGHDLTPKQRNDAEAQIVWVLKEVGFRHCEDQISVLGARQIADFAERYPGVASFLTPDPIQEAWIVEEWQRDTHMANEFEASPEQSEMIAKIRAGLLGETKHIRVLGEPGLGKTRIVLESVKDENIAPYTLYIEHGSRFGQTRLFRQLLKVGYNKPLVLVLDELPESELADIWRHLKTRCGSLKIVSLDHGRDETQDEDIDRLEAPRLSDITIKKILMSRVGESRELDRWVAICEGSPRVALAVADNLHANPGDLLKPPTTVPIWERFLHGYDRRNEETARQVDCVTQHLALFRRFGYEHPVGDEAKYISDWILEVDPTIGWARFQEIVQTLRARRVLQGSRTLFIVPRALQVYLWKKFWERYGRNFDFSLTLNSMPESLHAWFMSMFKYADGAIVGQVVLDILSPEGYFSQKVAIASGKGARFLSILAEGNPGGVLKLLESTLGKWVDQELLEFEENRQHIVWALGKISVWSNYSIRAIQLLARLASNENAKHSNNSTGTLIDLFRIGPEYATTESSPEERLPAVLQLLRSTVDAERNLGLKAIEAALDTSALGWRVVGPEYQGLKPRVELWRPKTYAEWGGAYLVYFQALVEEVNKWPSSLRNEVRLVLLKAVDNQLIIPQCTELAFQVLNSLVEDNDMPSDELTCFFRTWLAYKGNGKHQSVAKRLMVIERRYTKRNLVSRFQRYVVDVDWSEWDEECVERHDRPRSRYKALAAALARRISSCPRKFFEILELVTPQKNALGLRNFGENLALHDRDNKFLVPLITRSLEKRHAVCLYGYLSVVRQRDVELYRQTVTRFFGEKDTAWLGTFLTLVSDYDDEMFLLCLSCLGQGWIDPVQFSLIRSSGLELIPVARIESLLVMLDSFRSQEALVLIIELLDLLPFNAMSPFDSHFVFQVAARTLSNMESQGGMLEYHWNSVCLKLVEWDTSCILQLLDVLIGEMRKNFRLSYDRYTQSLANTLVGYDPSGAWDIIKSHLERSLPKWDSGIMNWLKGGLHTFDETVPRSAIVDLPVSRVLEWIEIDPEVRSALIAHAVPATLDGEHGGRLTCELLCRYSAINGVRSGVSCNFHSGGWSGPASAYLKRKREKLRRWLAAGFEMEITQWIETEIEYIDERIEREETNEERDGFD